MRSYIFSAALTPPLKTECDPTYLQLFCLVYELLLALKLQYYAHKSMLSSADGNFEVSLATKATLYHTGLVEVKDKYEEHTTQKDNQKPVLL